MRRVGSAATIAVGCTLTYLLVRATVIGRDNALVLTAILLLAPAWSVAYCWASDESDFPLASRSRDAWMRILPWTFVLAPLLLPNVVLLWTFFRDSRADHGLTWLGSGRSRPELDDHAHWP